MNIVVSVSRQPEWSFVFSQMREKRGWNPRYWITYNENHDQITREFPEAVTHNRLEINRGIPAQGLENYMSDALSKHDIDLFEPYLSSCMEILDRIDLDTSMSFTQRFRFINKLYVYWKNIIKYKEIECAIFNAPPHSIADYILYCTMIIYNKNNLFYRGTSLNNLHFLCTSVESLPGNLNTTYETILAGSLDVTLERAVVDSINELKTARPDYKPWYVKDANNRDKKHENIVEKIRNNFEKNLKFGTRFETGSPIYIEQAGDNLLKFSSTSKLPIREKRSKNSERELPRLFKVPGREIHEKMITLREYQDYRDWAMIKKIKMEEQYSRISRPLKKDRKFVYFAMHYQPERTTCPDGGIFSNQYLCVSLLSAALPEDMDIVIKEHPTQFSYTGMGELARWPGYYDDFLRLDNVYFVESSVSSLELLDKSSAVATVTGAVGWESLVRGKPVLHFGTAWYGACKGAYRITSEDDVKAALGDLESGKTHTENDVLSYAKALQFIGKTVYTTPTIEKGVNVEGDLGESLLSIIENYETPESH